MGIEMIAVASEASGDGLSYACVKEGWLMTVTMLKFVGVV